mmetsp:Transcript_73640/g.119530  ORF Transcript_73640/g.119530 Transcript_73640/m.119530 type:complete len:251 (-) Transcript_73640:381-1133(-)
MVGEGAVLEGSDVVFQTKIMNEHLICSLCMGYLRDAMTVTECLHTFCKPCIHQHFAEHLTCPTCEVHLGPVPSEKIRSDRAMQNIVDKVFPHFAKEEITAEKALQRAQTTAEEGGKQNDKTAAESEQKRNKVDGGVTKKKKRQEKDAQLASKKLCLSIFPNSGENVTQGSKLPQLFKPFLRSSVEATVKQYKNYLSSKLMSEHTLAVPSSEVELLCRGTSLRNDATLAAVWKEYWNSGEEDLQLTYHRRC